MGHAPGADKVRSFFQGVAAQKKKFFRVVGGIYHIGKGLHLVREEHGYNGAACRQILVHSGGDHAAVCLVQMDQVEQNVAAEQVIGHR